VYLLRYRRSDNGPTNGDGNAMFTRALELLVRWAGTLSRQARFDRNEILVRGWVRVTAVANLHATWANFELEGFVLSALCDPGWKVQLFEWVHRIRALSVERSPRRALDKHHVSAARSRGQRRVTTVQILLDLANKD